MLNSKFNRKNDIVHENCFNSSFQHRLSLRIWENHLVPQFPGGMKSIKHVLHASPASEEFKNNCTSNFQALKYPSVESQLNLKDREQAK